jgi:hypothetical protein
MNCHYRREMTLALTIGSFFSSNITKRVSPDILEERFALQIHRTNRTKRIIAPVKFYYKKSLEMVN